MPLLIDAYNVLHVTGVLPPGLAGLDVDALARLVALTQRAPRGRAVLVCDGTGGQPGARFRRSGGASETRSVVAPGVEIMYAGALRDADSLLERLIDEDSAPGRLLVVSSDRRVQRAARRRRAGVLSAEGFLRRLAAELGASGITSLEDLDRRDAGQGAFGASPAPASSHPLRAQVPLDAFSTAAWMNYFGYDARDLVANAGAARAANSLAPEPLPMPARPPVTEAARPSHGRERATAPGMRPRSGAGGAQAQAPAATDPLLAEAIRAWDGRLTLEDLEMERWLGGLIERPRD